jgi:hypothetical protein
MKIIKDIYYLGLFGEDISKNILFYPILNNGPKYKYDKLLEIIKKIDTLKDYFSIIKGTFKSLDFRELSSKK